MLTRTQAIYHAILLTTALSAVFFVFYISGMAQAFTGPTAAAPSGSGIINVSGSNIGIGTASPSAELDVEGTSAGIKVGNSSSSYVISPESTGAAITSSGSYIRWITGGSEGMRLTNGNLVVTGTISGSYTGTASAANLSAGTFGANTGGGNYSFPANVGIGTTTPSTALGVNGDVGLSARLEFNSPNAYGGSSAVFGLMSAANATRFLFFDYASSTPLMTINDASAGGGVLIGSGYISQSATPNTAPANGLAVQGSVGIGTTAPASMLSVGGVGDPSIAIYGDDGTNGYGVYGVSRLAYVGGVMGVNSVAGGYGVEGNASGANGFGVEGVGGNDGVYGQSEYSSTGNGVVGVGGAIGVLGASGGTNANTTGVEGLGGTSGIGVYAYTSGGTGIDFKGGHGEYTSGSSWVNGSSRDLKTDFTPVDDQAILSGIASLPITKWVYKTDTGAWHIGPVAEDFYSIFGLGDNNKSISTIDPAGVALVGVKALDENMSSQQTEIAAQQAQINTQQTQITTLQTQNATLQKEVGELLLKK